MSVYVDPLREYGGSKTFRWTVSCHMYADTLDELHEMATAVGMKRAWFQNKPRLPHYDLVAARRAKAVQRGAVQHSLREMVEFMRRRRGLGKKSAGALTVPEFKNEAEEAAWWDSHPTETLELLKQAAKEGTIGRGTLARRAKDREDRCGVLKEGCDEQCVYFAGHKEPVHKFGPLLPWPPTYFEQELTGDAAGVQAVPKVPRAGGRKVQRAQKSRGL